MKPSSKKPAAKTKKTISKKILILVVLLLIIALGAFVAYRIHQNKIEDDRAFEADKARFAKVEADMEQLHKTLVNILGTPSREDIGKSCSRVNLKFEEGDLSCHVSYVLNYPAQPIDIVQGNIEKIKQALSESNDFTLTDYSKNRTITLTSISSAHQRVGFDIANKHVQTCNIEAQLTSKDQMQPTVAYEQVYNLKCSAGVKQAIYPLAE